MTVACSSTPPAPPAPPDAVARYSGGYVTRAEVERQLGSVPRHLQPDRDPREWVARRIAWREVLADRWRAEVEGSRRYRLALREGECRVAVEKLMEDLAATVEVSPADVEEELDRQRLLAAGRGESLRLRHLFLRADSTMSEAERDAQRALAGQLLDRARAGESFEQLAREYSQSETASSGGLLSGLRRGRVEKSFDDAAFALEAGQLSDVVTTSRGYHLILLEDRFTPPPFVEEQVRSTVTARLRTQAVQERKAELVARLESAGSCTKRWDAEGQLHPDGDGVVLEVGDLVVTADELDPVEPGTSGPGKRPTTPVERLTDILESELLCREALVRGLVSREEIEQERARVADDRMRRMAEELELEELRAEVTREDVDRFVAEHADRAAVPGEVRVQVMLLGFEGGEGYDTYLMARELADRARAGESFVELVRRHSVGPNAEEGGDSGLVAPDRLATLGPEFAQAVDRLEPGGITDPTRVPPSRLGPLQGRYEGAFAVARLVERRERRFLDPATEGEELRRRFWQSEKDRIVEERVQEDLVHAGFELLESPPE